MDTSSDNGSSTMETAKVSCGSSKGPLVMEFYSSWSPNGYPRVVELFERGFYDNSHLFRCIPHFLCQFGITYSDDEELRNFMEWDAAIPDDPIPEDFQFHLGTIAFAGGGKNSRTTQIFISLGDIDQFGDNPWETPLGKVVEGIENVLQWYSYGNDGVNPKQGRIEDEGASYIEENFPLIDKLEKCTVQKFRNGAAVNPKKKHTVKLSMSDVDASALILPERGLLMAIVFVLAIAFYLLFGKRAKHQTKTN